MKNLSINKIEFPVAIIGMGLTGKSIYRLLKYLAKDQQKIVRFDENPAREAEYRDPNSLLQHEKPKTLVVSPGVPLQSKWIQDFQRNGGKIDSELNIAFSFLETEKTIAVTGSLGKSTLVTLLQRAASTNHRTQMCGNIGFPLADYIYDRITKKFDAVDYVILELSSFQLENFESLHCDASAISYLAANHLERYNSIQEYYEWKWSLVTKTEGICFLNTASEELNKFAKVKGDSKVVFCDEALAYFTKKELHQAKLLGQHNRSNLAMAAAIAEYFQWEKSYKRALLDFPGLEHRLQLLGEVAGITAINDSKATTIASVQSAIMASLQYKKTAKGSIWVLLGGRDKNLPWHELNDLAQESKLKFLFFGECANQVQQQSGLSGDSFSSLKSLLNSIPKFIHKGDIILLSPGGASQDEFENFEARGNAFALAFQSSFSQSKN